jgi:hypothetical protein
MSRGGESNPRSGETALAEPRSETNRITLNKILAFAAIVEVATGAALLVDPAMVVALLLGANENAEGMPLARVAGCAMLALGLACWPGRNRAQSAVPAFWGMLAYNVLIALYLTYLGTLGHLGGVLLWPAVALHAVVALLMAWTWRDEGQTRATTK